MRRVAVVAVHPCRHARPDEQRMTQPALHRAAPLDLLDHRSIEADPGVETEVPAVHLAEADRAEVSGVDAVGQFVDGGHRVVGHAECAGEHVGGTAGQHAECGVGAGNTRGDLVQGAVAAETDHHVDTTSRSIVGESRGVAPTVCLDHLHVVFAAQSPVHDHGVACRHRRGEGVDHEQDPQDADGSEPAALLRPSGRLRRCNRAVAFEAELGSKLTDR